MAETNLFTCDASYKYKGIIYKYTGRIYADYTITETETAYTINSSIKIGGSGSGWSFRNARSSTGASSYGDWRLNNDTNQDFKSIYSQISSLPVTLSTANKSVTITKTHSAQSIPLYCSLRTTVKFTIKPLHGSLVDHDTTIIMSAGANTAYFTVPARASYAVSYNSDGGTPTPSNQTKWYGEDLTLSTSVPYKEGFRFGGWTASNGTVYQPGDTYSANEATTLTAIWVEAGPKIKVKVNGEWEEGELKAKVNGEWVDAEAAYVKVDGAWIEIN